VTGGAGGRAAAGGPVTFVHLGFGRVGGAEVLVARQLALLHGAGVPVRLITDRVAWDRWRDALGGFDVREVAPDPRPTLAERALAPLLRHAPRLRAARSAARARPHVGGSRCVVAGNYPASVVAPSVASGLPTAWCCNEPPRHVHFVETMPYVGARLRADGGPGASAALAWAVRMFARTERRARRPHVVAERALDRRRVAALGRVVTISGYADTLVRRVYGRGADAVVSPVVPAAAPGRARTGLDRAGLRVLTHGRLEHLKNVDTVLRGFAAFARAHPGDHALHVVGEGEALAPLRALAEALGLGGAVRFHGFLPAAALAAVYDACDVLAALPLDEPFGMVFPEAAFRGLLAVGPDHGGPREILDDGRLGWTVDPLAPAALADALGEAWRLTHADADRRRAAFAEACRARYSPAAVLPRLRAALGV
jgi:glycosyltransferase involved in cell wall biosynthesis